MGVQKCSKIGFDRGCLNDFKVDLVLNLPVTQTTNNVHAQEHGHIQWDQGNPNS